MIDFKDMIQLSHGMTIYLTNLFLTFNNMYIQARAFFSSNGLIRTFRFPLHAVTIKTFVTTEILKPFFDH